MNYFRDKKRTLKNIKTEIIDHSDNKDIDKIRTLILLGVVDNLHKTKYQHSVNKLASHLSGATGIRADTIKGYINAYLSTPNGKNNPMNKEEPVRRLKNKLDIQ